MTAPAGKFEVVCDAPSHERRTIRFVRWNGGGRYAFGIVADGMSLDSDDAAVAAGWKNGRSRWSFRCPGCGDHVVARTEKAWAEVLQKLTEAGVSAINLTDLRAIMSK